MRKGQVSLEFIIFLAVVLMIFAAASFAALQANKGIVEDNEVVEARRLASAVVREINIAVEIGDGYSRVFSLPPIMQNGANYSVVISDSSFVSVLWKNKTYSLPTIADNITGGVINGQNSVRNSNGVIYFG